MATQIGAPLSGADFHFINTDPTANSRPNLNSIPVNPVVFNPMLLPSMSSVPVGPTGIYLDGKGGTSLTPPGTATAATALSSALPGFRAAGGSGSGGGCTPAQSPFSAAMNLMNGVSGGGGDPTYDEYEENIANGNNTTGTKGSQPPNTPNTKPPVQTSLPPPTVPPAKVTELTPPPGGNGWPTTCMIWDGSNYGVSISPHFKLKDFTTGAYWPHPLTSGDVAGFSMQTRFCNLQAVALNIAEPMYAKFGTMRINSGIRNESTTKSGISQHVAGQAIDIQFSGWTYNMYWNNAMWVKDNIPYDQFIFEHSSTTGLAWYHLSFNRAGNRAASVSTKVMTMYRNNYSSGLHRYG